MVRAAAKNHPSVAVVTSPARYADVLDGRHATAASTWRTRKRLAAEAFQHTAAYDVAVASWFADGYAAADDSAFPEFLGATCERKNVLRYGENPHQARRALRRRHAAGSRRPSSCTARRCRTTTTRTPTPRAVPRTTTTSRASRSSSTPTPAASRSARTSPRRTARRTPVTRCPRSAASSPSTARSPWRWPSRSPRSSPRSSSPPATRTARSRSSPRKKNIRVLRCPDAPSNPVEVKPDRRRRAAPGHRPPPGRGRRPGQLDAGHAATRCPPASWPSWPSPGGPAAP